MVIPKSIREEVGLQEGQRALVHVEDGKIVIEPFPGDPFKTLDKVIREPYDEAREEKRVERWLRKHAGR